MPKRSNEFQAIVFMIKQHVAPAGATVTESKEMRDARTTEDREVDVVIEFRAADEDIVISAEVQDRSRPADIQWVEQQIAKHESLPTQRLVLVSRSGFSKRARLRADAAGGWVSTVQPEYLPDGRADDLFITSATTTPRRIMMKLEVEGGELLVDNVPLNADLYNEALDNIGTFHELYDRLMSEQVWPALAQEQLDQQDWGNDTFHFEVDARTLGLWGKTIDGEHLRILEFGVVGDLASEHRPLRFDVFRFDRTLAGIARGAVRGQPTVWVATPNTDGQPGSKISFRSTPKPQPRSVRSGADGSPLVDGQRPTAGEPR